MKKNISSLDLPTLEALSEPALHTVIIFDELGIIKATNTSIQHDFGYTPEELTGHSISCLIPSDHNDNHASSLKRHKFRGHYPFLSEMQYIDAELMGKRKNGSTFPMHLHLTELCTVGTKTFVGICHDISEQRRHSARLAQLATYDNLTGCFNRHQLINILDNALIHCKNTNEHLAVLFIDLDKFKQINDNYGHTVGDKVLIQVVNRFRKILRSSDSLGRIGGDEFIALIMSSNEQTLTAIPNRLIQSLEAPFTINALPLQVSASIGISLYPQHGETSDDLVSAADIAMYQVKSRNYLHYCLFSKDMRTQSEQAFQLATRLREALRNDKFELHYQLQFDLNNCTPSGLEALIRWRDEEKNLILPSDFLPLAQKYGLIPEITRWVLRRACQDNAHLIEHGILNVPIGVNISAASFCNYDFVRIVTTICEDTKLPLSRLEIEITEDVAMHNLDLVTQHSIALRENGISLAMDDFGTGHSSLSRLRNLRFHKLKIDRSFIKELSENLADQEIVRAILGVARALDIQVVAEGIETEDQIKWLRDKGCAYGQGFWFARPMPLAELTQWLTGNRGACSASTLGQTKTGL
ncbi:putative bifunctional diguanylate cyclase/phosphodiesterase [Pseudomonas sp. GZD-209]|uniref:putative bifunctional diguanylate cyclase/phosphodiesterase n=1 Tax=Pseudomonas sp. GZD-209 TaxID=3404807 RepID=UPI003BB5168F